MQTCVRKYWRIDKRGERNVINWNCSKPHLFLAISIVAMNNPFFDDTWIIKMINEPCTLCHFQLQSKTRFTMHTRSFGRRRSHILDIRMYKNHEFLQEQISQYYTFINNVMFYKSTSRTREHTAKNPGLGLRFLFLFAAASSFRCQNSSSSFALFAAATAWALL